MELKEVVILACGRSAIGKAIKGSLKNEHPVENGAQILRGVLDRVPDLDRNDIEDVVIGCARHLEKQGKNMARLIALRAGLPNTVCGQTINRFCSSGLQAVATAANAIACGQMNVVVAGGVETMNADSVKPDKPNEVPWLIENVNVYIPMGMTAENVAKAYGITREEMDAFAVESHRKATAAREAGKFKKEIVPMQVKNEAGEMVTFDTDECIRPNTTMEGLANLKPCFIPDTGLVTAGTASQMSDGAAMVVMASREYADAHGLKPLARFVGFAVVGVDPTMMGIGPMKAVPKVMAATGLTVQDMDVIEINEAFAAQAIPCIRELGMDMSKVNPNGGAIALGHPLGATGSILICKALSELERTGGRYGLVTMCVGLGMGAAGIIERL